MPRIVGIGGGTGLPVLLRGLADLAAGAGFQSESPDLQITAIVCVSDNGGSSGHLRRALDIPAVGDLRNCLIALADRETAVADLFQHRFPSGKGLNGHSLGNLMVAALCSKSASLSRAVAVASELLNARGTVLPVTDASVTLCAELERQGLVCGETEISASRSRVRKLWLAPQPPAAGPGVLEAIDAADAIVLGPGSLYTSVLPSLLVNGVAAAIRNSPALKIYVCNLMTQPGETAGFTAADHVRTLESYLGFGVTDRCVVNSRPPDWELVSSYFGSGSEPVLPTLDESMQAEVVEADLLGSHQHLIRHDSAKLAHLIVSLASEHREPRSASSEHSSEQATTLVS